MMIGGIWLSTVITNFYIFFPLFAFSFGVSGFFYSIILQKAWMYFPGKEGAVSGTVIAGFGIGGFACNALASEWLNPDEVDPVKFDKADVT
jgi:hypothetical protein